MLDGGWVDEAIAGLNAAIDALDLSTLSLPDARLRRLVVELGEAAARLEARRLAAVGDLDTRPGAVPGAAAGRGAVTFLIHGTRSSRARAHADVAAAALIDPDSGALRVLGAALAAGEVSRAHLDVAARAMQKIPKRLLRAVGRDGLTGAQRVDEFLVEHCRRFAPDDVRILVRQLLAVLDPGGADRFDQHAFERRDLRTHVDATGMLIGTFQLDPEGGATVRAALDHYGAPRPLRWAVDENGQAVEVRDVRCRGQRDADALVAICRKALSSADTDPERVGRMPAHVTVTATVQQVSADGQRPAGLAHCDQLGPVASPVLERLVCDGLLHRVLTAASGAVLDVGRTVRCATPGQRKALAVRDGGCVVPGCAVPVALCDVHHVRSWAQGGLTDLDNLAPLCPAHHSAAHAGVWTIRVRGGLPWVIPPAWVDPQRRPLRNNLPAATRAALTLGQQITQPEGSQADGAAGAGSDGAESAATESTAGGGAVGESGVEAADGKPAVQEQPSQAGAWPEAGLLRDGSPDRPSHPPRSAGDDETRPDAEPDEAEPP